jgi:hypothetical protein
MFKYKLYLPRPAGVEPVTQTRQYRAHELPARGSRDVTSIPTRQPGPRKRRPSRRLNTGPSTGPVIVHGATGVSSGTLALLPWLIHARTEAGHTRAPAAPNLFAASSVRGRSGDGLTGRHSGWCATEALILRVAHEEMAHLEDGQQPARRGRRHPTLPTGPTFRS